MDLTGWQLRNSRLEVIDQMAGWVSPRLGVRFELSEEELQIYRPDGDRFLTYLELDQQRQQEKQRAEQAEARAEQERQRAEKAESELQALRAFNVQKKQKVNYKHSALYLKNGELIQSNCDRI